MPFRPRLVVFHPRVRRRYESVEAGAAKSRQPAQAIWKGFKTAIARIKADGQWGEVIPQSGIPEYFRSEYGVTNLYCIDLAAFHRFFYTLRDRDVVVLDLVDHGTYDRLFRL